MADGPQWYSAELTTTAYVCAPFPSSPGWLFELVDDRGENPACLRGLRADDAQPLHGQHVSVDLLSLVDVPGACYLLDVDHVRQLGLAEPQDGERAQGSVTSGSERGDLKSQVMPGTQLQKVLELVAQDVRGTDPTPQRRLIDDHPEPELSLDEPALPFPAQGGLLLSLAGREVAEGEDCGCVLRRLQQGGYEQRLVGADAYR